jgi:hypothetical protein
LSATCSSCGGANQWVVTVTGKRMPLDAAPSPEAERAFFVVDGRAVSAAGLTVEASQCAIAKAPRYLSHFATCAQAAQHRKPR